MFVVRDATFADWPHVCSMIEVFLVEQFELGGEMIPSEQTRAFYERIFRGVCMGETEGHALVLEYVETLSTTIVGWHIAITFEPEWETKYGKASQGLGVFVSGEYRGRGLLRLLYAEGETRSRNFGCKVLYGQVFLGNHGRMQSKLRNWGMEPVAIAFAKPL